MFHSRGGELACSWTCRISTLQHPAGQTSLKSSFRASHVAYCHSHPHIHLLHMYALCHEAAQLWKHRPEATPEATRAEQAWEGRQSSVAKIRGVCTKRSPPGGLQRDDDSVCSLVRSDKAFASDSVPPLWSFSLSSQPLPHPSPTWESWLKVILACSGP